MAKVNRYSIRSTLPSILTGLSCVGVIATGVLSVRAGYNIRQNLEDYKYTPTNKDIAKEVLREVTLPAIVGTSTIGCFCIARTIDKKTIAALSASVAALSQNLYPDVAKQQTKDNIPKVQVDYVVDEDGEVYYETYSNLYIKMKHETLLEVLLSLNKNYQLRAGMASLYEFLRLLGITRKFLKENGLSWTQFIGWRHEWMEDISYIEYVLEPFEDAGYSNLYFMTPLMPLCINPPRIVKNITNCETEDIEHVGIIDGGADVTTEIRQEIQDKWCE